MNVTREQITAAMADYDRDPAAFLAAHGYRKCASYVLHHEGRSYPSKAILGVAAGLSAREFSGGAAHTAATLRKLGFRVKGVGRIMAALFLAASALGYRGVPEVRLNDGPVASFASGANLPGEIQGFAKIGHDIGVAAPEVRERSERALVALAGTDIQVFLDSGAFSEVEFDETRGELVVVHPISEAEWTKRLQLARRLAVALGDQLHVVAPDRIGSQVDTLARLTRWKEEILAIRASGARILVAMQQGALSRIDFAAEVDRVLGFRDWTPALPMKKAPMTPAEVEAFVRARQPRMLHLLGLGTGRSNAAEIFSSIHRAAPDCLFSCDAVLVRRYVGKTNGPGGGPRAYTAAVETLRQLFARHDSWSSTRRKKAAVILCFGWGAWSRKETV